MGLTQLNVWLDAIFLTLYPIVVVALVFHFGGNMLTGRAKRRFKGWQWPVHDSHPPFLPKFLHFTHVFSMIMLGFTGLMIRFNPVGRPVLQVLHYIFMLIVIANLVWRLWYAFASRQRDYREFALTKQDIVTAPLVILYYIFVKPSKPHLDKYNVMQKCVYMAFAPMLMIQAVTGLMIWRMDFPIVDASLYDASAALVGATAIFWVRTVHYIMNWLFIVFTTIHVYLSLSEDFPAFLHFFGLSFLDRPNQNPEAHEHGHGHDHDPAAQPAVD